jgi:exonuclease III
MDNLNVATWNVRGLTDRHRKILARNWLANLQHPVHILLLQELKIDSFLLETTLSYMCPRFIQVCAPPVEGRGGVAILLDPAITLLSSGNAVAGQAAWAQIQTSAGPVNIASVYAPNLATERRQFWKDLKERLPRGNWLVGGDYNMVEVPHDSTSSSPLISPFEHDSWQVLKLQLSLQDAFDIIPAIGPRYTRRGTNHSV